MRHTYDASFGVGVCLDATVGSISDLRTARWAFCTICTVYALTSLVLNSWFFQVLLPHLHHNFADYILSSPSGCLMRSCLEFFHFLSLVLICSQGNPRVRWKVAPMWSRGGLWVHLGPIFLLALSPTKG